MKAVARETLYLKQVVSARSILLKDEAMTAIVEQLTRMGYTHLSQIRFVRQPMRVGGLWECEVAV